jgi:hypothetical protein
LRIVTSLAFLLAASILPIVPATAQTASDGISTSQYVKSPSGRSAYRSRGYSRGYARTQKRYTGRAHARSQARSYGHSHTHSHSHRGGASASRACLTGDTRALLSRFEARFGSVKVISTCRPGAVIAGSGRPSQHRYGKAVDFMPNPGQRGAMLAWLRSNANGAVITYASGHIHFDTGGDRNFAVSAKARRAYARGL